MQRPVNTACHQHYMLAMLAGCESDFCLCLYLQCWLSKLELLPEHCLGSALMARQRANAAMGSNSSQGKKEL